MIDLVRELVEPSRRALLAELKAGPRTVSDLVAASGLKQPNVSNHLSRLRAKGILRATKVGRQVYYSYADPDVAKAAMTLIAPASEPSVTIKFGQEATKAFSRAACQGDEQACTEMVDALARGTDGIVKLYSSLFAESMKMIGQWWMVQAIDEGQEHLASAIIERLMARVLHYASPPPPGALKVVIGCSQDNWHTIGVRMISDVMRLRGWRTLYLGANVPTASFVNSMLEHQPDAVMVSCPLEEAVPEALVLVTKLAEAKRKDCVVGVGGCAAVRKCHAFNSAGADFWSQDLVEFSDEILPLLTKKDIASLKGLMEVRANQWPRS